MKTCVTADSSIQQLTDTVRHSDHLEHLLKYNMLNLKHQKEGKQHSGHTAPEQQSQEMALKENRNMISRRQSAQAVKESQGVKLCLQQIRCCAGNVALSIHFQSSLYVFVAAFERR